MGASSEVGTLDNLFLEKIPATGVYQCFNAQIKLGGYEMIRVSRALVRANVGTGKFEEIGTRYGTPYYREKRVSFSITKALTNFYTILLSIGLPVSKDHVSGWLYSETEGTTKSLATLLELFTEDVNDSNLAGLNSDRPKNTYPIKTDAEFIINKDGVLSGNYPDIENRTQDVPDSSKRYQMALFIKGAIIDANQLQVGAGGDIVIEGPMDVPAETADWILYEVTSE